MKKKKNKEKKAEKKAKKQAEKQKRYCATALEWSNIEMIDGNAIYIRDGNMQERVIGLKVIPRNIFIDTSYVQARVVNNLRIIFNKVRFPIYWQYSYRYRSTIMSRYCCERRRRKKTLVSVR